MLTLAATDTVAGVAGAFTVTCTLFGMELAGGVETYKKLSQGVLSNAGAATVYTAPAATQTFVKSIHLVNTSSTAVTGVQLFVKGTAAGNRITGSLTIPGNGWAVCGEDGWRIYDQSGALQTGLVTALAFKFNTATSGDPGSGHFGFDNATFASASVLRINRTTAEGFVVGLHLSAMLNVVPKCTAVFKSTDGTKIFNFTCLGTTFFTDNSTYYSVQITPLTGSSSVVNDQAFSCEFYLYGVDGPGVPSGGTNGQFLKKNSGTNYDTVWVNFPARQPILTAAADYYVRPGGDDTHTGTVNSDAFAFKTIQKAIDTVGTLDISTFGANIHVADATYAEKVLVNGPWVGPGTVTLVGNNTTPANVVVDSTSFLYTTYGSQEIAPLTLQSGATLSISGILVKNTQANVNIPGICARFGGTLKVTGNVEFGAVGRQVSANSGGQIIFSTGYRISGDCNYHWFASQGTIICEGRTITLVGSRTWTAAFATGAYTGVAYVDSNTYSGTTPTGKKYEVQANGVILEANGGTTAFPGSIAGTTATGGQYI